MNGEPIQVGDVCLDLTQGRPVHVVEDTGQTAADWSEANDYELCENYGNSRLDAADDDAVFECVYCSSAKSEPSRTYAFPESRLLRIETEAADDGRRVYDRVAVDLLEAMFAHALGRDEDLEAAWLQELAVAVGVDADAVDEAWELADVAQTIGSEEVSE
jgi:hypothetical protein